MVHHRYKLTNDYEQKTVESYKMVKTTCRLYSDSGTRVRSGSWTTAHAHLTSSARYEACSRGLLLKPEPSTGPRGRTAAASSSDADCSGLSGQLLLLVLYPCDPTPAYRGGKHTFSLWRVERFYILRKAMQPREASLDPKWRWLHMTPKAVRGCFPLWRGFLTFLASGPKTSLLLFPEAEIFIRGWFLLHTVVKSKHDLRRNPPAMIN